MPLRFCCGNSSTTNGGPELNKQKKELRQRQSTRQLMGISQLTQHGIRTAEGELVFYLIKPDNLSVLSEDGIRGRVMALTRLLCTMPQVQMLALDSRESFRRNKDWYRLRLEQEELPAISRKRTPPCKRKWKQLWDSSMKRWSRRRCGSTLTGRRFRHGPSGRLSPIGRHSLWRLPHLSSGRRKHEQSRDIVLDR